MLRYATNCEKKCIYKVTAYIHTESPWKVKKKRKPLTAAQEGNRSAREPESEEHFSWDTLPYV